LIEKISFLLVITHSYHHYSAAVLDFFAFLYRQNKGNNYRAKPADRSPIISLPADIAILFGGGAGT
jgi:hypothetical protein